MIVRDYDNKIVRGVKVEIKCIESMRDREGRPTTQTRTIPVVTNSNGQASASFLLQRPGAYRLQALALDSDRNLAYAARQVYVQKEHPVVNRPQLSIRFDQSTPYLPGETAKLRIKSTLVGAWALLTIEGEQLYVQRVIRITAPEFFLPLPVRTEYLPVVAIRLNIIQKGTLYADEASLQTSAAEKQLSLILTPDKTTYRPGEQARYDVTVRDARGRGVAAELGLGVVDQALYALQQETSPNPYTFFWHPQAERIDTVFSLSSTYPGGGYQVFTSPAVLHSATMPAPPPPSGIRWNHEDIAQKSPERIRRNFADIAYWAPSFLSGPDGQGQVSFTMPDNLTSWRATARAVDKSTHAGEAKADVKVNMPLMVRLVLPRFLVQGDTVTAAAIVHNNSGAEQKVQVMMTAQNAEILDAPQRDIVIANGDMQRLSWQVRPSSALGTAGNVRILVSADAGTVNDAMESVLPLLPNGVKRVIGTAGMSAKNAQLTLKLPETALPGTALLELSLSPSLAGPIFSSLDYLVSYPYGCAEQTMDSFLPSIIAARAFNTLGVQREKPELLQRYVSFGLQKLLRYQHQDGGWHWWENDESDPYISAYIVYGLALARDAGYPLAAGALPRGAGYLANYLKKNDYTSQAYILWALAAADVWPEKRFAQAVDTAQTLYQQRAKLDTFSRASLTLAFSRLSRHPGAPAALAAQARTMIGELQDSAITTGTAVHWTANAVSSGNWLDSDVEVTSQVLRALLDITPDNQLITPAVHWLMTTRNGNYWNSTKDTASAVLVLTDYLLRNKELAPDETVAVKLGDRTIQTITMGKAQLFSNPIKVQHSCHRSAERG